MRESVLKCLIADNNDFYLEFFSDILKNYGYEVDVAQDGLIALNLARNIKYDLFIFDYIMPKIDGIRLSKYVKSISHYANTPIILITAAALESINMDDTKNCADLFIAKGPLEKMKEIFDEVIPNIEKIIKSDNKKVLGLANIYPRQIVRELLRTELNHSAIFKNLIEGVVQLDEDGKILFVNDSFCRYLNLLEQDVVGRKIEEIFKYEDFPEIKDSIFKLKMEKKSAKESIVINYFKKTFHLSFYNVLNEKDLYSGMFIILQDVTELRKKVNEITTIFNITQAFLSNIPYKNVLEYVSYELRRLIKATDVSIILSCDGFFKGEVIENRDRKLSITENNKINYWLEKIIDWKKTGLVSVKNVKKLSKLKFEDISTLWLPLVFQNIYLGTLLGFKQSSSDFEEEDIRFFEAVGNQIAVYLSNIEFFNRFVSDKQKNDEAAKISDILADDIFIKNSIFKWEERQKKKVIQKICENLSSTLTVFEGYLRFINNETYEITEEEKKLYIDKIISAESKLKALRDELWHINKTGSSDESELHIFDLNMLAKRLRSMINSDMVDFSEEIIAFKKWGDFDKITFYIKKIVEELISMGSEKIHIKLFKENEAGVIEIESSLSDLSKEIIETVKLISDSSWQESEQLIYFYLWSLKQTLELINSQLAVQLAGNRLNVKLIFTS